MREIIGDSQSKVDVKSGGGYIGKVETKNRTLRGWCKRET